MQIDNQLNNAATFAINTALFQNDPQLALSSKESESVLAKQRISLTLSEQIVNIGNIIDTLFVFTDDDFIPAHKISLETAERSAVKSYVIEMAPELETNGMKSRWNIAKINNHFSMVYISTGDNGVVTGFYVNLDRLISHYTPNDSQISLLLLRTQEATTVRSEHSESGVVITVSSRAAPISFVEIIPFDTILKSLPFMQKYTLIVSIMVLLLLPFTYFLLRTIVVQPIQKLNNAMKHIQRGELQFRISPYRVSNEIAVVNQTFNQMMDEVQELKISVYEEEIKAQKSRLRNLQMQIQPHFIINSLNMVYNLLENNDPQTAKKMIVHSVDFYRYMVKVDIDLVPLYEEIRHVNTYLQIQSIRYKNKFTYSIETSPLIADMLVPPMLIQNFVENSIKYAIQADKNIHISVNVESFEVDFYPYAKIIISDTGYGYPDHQLERLNQGRVIIDQNGEHIGIRNSVQRLSLLFEGKAKWRFFNQNGAVSELIVPAQFTEQVDSFQLDEE